jgi:hypothetical protein
LGCNESTQKSQVNSDTADKRDNCDSAFAYADFDWNNFKGVGNRVNENTYPYVSLCYQGQKAVMEVHKPDKEVSRITFFRYKGYWANLSRTKFKRHGEYHYFLSVFIPEQCVAIEYVGNPFKQADSEMFEIAFKRSHGNNFEDKYYLVSSEGMRGLPTAETISESYIRKYLLEREHIISELKHIWLC